MYEYVYVYNYSECVGRSLLLGLYLFVTMVGFKIKSRSLHVQSYGVLITIQKSLDPSCEDAFMQYN